MRRCLTAAILYVTFLLSFSLHVCAREIVSREEGLDIIFVMDCSGSMRSNDPDGIGRGMMKAFVDTVHAESIRIGFVAYSDAIVAKTPPVSIAQQAKRDDLKELIDSVPYAGDTDIGLGLSEAYALMEAQEGRRRVIVLISDGVSDLPGSGSRTLRASDEEMARCISQCTEEGVPIYTIAFGEYEGSRGILEKMAADTGAESYAAADGDALIEVLYGIFSGTLSYTIEQFSSGVYAGGEQEIRCVLDEPYLDEVDVLLVSSEKTGQAVIVCGGEEIPMLSQSCYAAGKISGTLLGSRGSEVSVRTMTNQGQELKVFLVGYRNLTPVFQAEETISRNRESTYQVYFRDKNGDIIYDEAFYRQFAWTLTCAAGGNPDQNVQIRGVQIREGILEGSFTAAYSGICQLTGELSDRLGVYRFETMLEVVNSPPQGTLPQLRIHTLQTQTSCDLDRCFHDEDGDSLTYAIEKGPEENADAWLEDNYLCIQPRRPGIQTLTLIISDGEAQISCPAWILVVPFWQAYWWLVLPLVLAAAVLLFKIFYRPKPELEVIEEKKAGNHFVGRLDAYVTLWPDDLPEIPPLTFPMHKIKNVRVCVGDLLKEYPELAQRLGLSEVFLIADEERRMILYHSTDATVMIGGSIVCRQLQYRVGFGDIIYITAQNGACELELHYISVIQ